MGEIDGIPYVAIGNGEPCPKCRKPFDSSHIEKCLFPKEEGWEFGR